MRRLVILSAAALAAAAMSAPAMADDPNDPAMATRTARERDRATIRKLNQDQLAYVRERDARYAEGWRAYDGRGHSSGSDARYREQVRAYEADRRHYEEAMADWREDVAACRAGYYEHCRR